MIEFEIDGKKITTAEGSTVIEAADAAGIYIPRFCYHKKLDVVANCRMCLVEVSGSRKPLPACATQVTADMKVFTKSAVALAAQRSVMEFLLINHPLDCPICDQGGECELQDLSMGFGNAGSEYTETKRAVFSEDLGPLIETEMTRCIHCTRCVRFGDEIANLRELGATGRGEHMEIGTYVKHFMRSELSGNVIDLCPVGALTNKPARYEGRSWEYIEHPMIAPHDGVGTNTFIHTRHEEYSPKRMVMRSVPRENDAINETWMSDRDRYSCHGLYHESRVYKPRIKQAGQWVEVEWERALLEIADRVQAIVTQMGPEQVAALASPSSSTEELYVLQKLMRGVGSHNIDHRLHQHDFSWQHQQPNYPELGLKIADIDEQQLILLIGSNVRYEQPILANRMRKAVVDNGAEVMIISAIKHDCTFALADEMVVAPQQLAQHLAEIAKALADAKQKTYPLLANITPSAKAQEIAQKLQATDKVAIFTGEEAINHACASHIQQLSQLIADLAGAKYGEIHFGANAAGAWVAGALPHRTAGAKPVASPGLDAKRLLSSDPVRAYLLLNIEPEFDCAYGARALDILADAGLVVCMTPFVSAAMERYADFILPIAPFSETAGTFINMEGRWQSFAACTLPHGEAKPAWKILRVLAHFLKIEGLDYKTSHEIKHELKQIADTMPAIPAAEFALQTLAADKPAELERLALWPMYRVDNLVRRSEPLQAAPHEKLSAVMSVNANTADKLGLKDGETVLATQGKSQLELPLVIDQRVADHCVLIPAAYEQTAGFGDADVAITLQRRQ